MGKTTILIKDKTRDKLRNIGRKDQTYDDLITELILLRGKTDPLDSSLKDSESSGSIGGL